MVVKHNYHTGETVREVFTDQLMVEYSCRTGEIVREVFTDQLISG